MLFGGVVNHGFPLFACKDSIFNNLTINKLKQKERLALGVRS